jgi:hypothetical protein
MSHDSGSNRHIENGSSPLVPIGGKTFGVKDQIKALGGKWDQEKKVWMVPPSRSQEAKQLVEEWNRRNVLTVEERKRRLKREKTFYKVHETPETVYQRAMKNCNLSEITTRIAKNRRAWESKLRLAEDVGVSILLRLEVVGNYIEETYAMPDGTTTMRKRWADPSIFRRGSE